MSTLRIGCAAADITPGLGVFMAGYFHERNATAIHDNLFARCLVFDDGVTTLALISCDLACVPADQTALVREAVARLTGIPAANVMVTGTHTHTGPRVRTFLIQEDGSGPTLDWLAGFPDQAAQGVADALSDLEPCTLSHAVAFEDRIAFNRRYRMRDGTVRSIPGQMIPDILGPAGPIDPEVSVICLARPDGSRKAVLVHYACHLDNVGGTEISADYPGYLARRLDERLDDRPFVLYLQGACGDINHVNVHSPYRRQGHEHSRWMGETLAGDVCQALGDLEPLPAEGLAVAGRILDLPRSDQVAEDYGCFDRAEIQALRIGDLGIVGIPAEYFVEFQLDIKRRSPFGRTLVAELANGWIGYAPTRKAFEENMPHVSAQKMQSFDHLGYEVRSALARGFLPGVGEVMADAAVELLQQLRG